jgi:hypothetical protein
MSAYDITIQAPMSASIVFASAFADMPEGMNAIVIAKGGIHYGRIDGKLRRACSQGLLLDGMGTLTDERDGVKDAFDRRLSYQAFVEPQQKIAAIRRERQRVFTGQVCDEAKAILARKMKS